MDGSIRRSARPWRTSGALLVALGLALLAYGLARHGDFPPPEAYSAEGGGTILLGCGSIFEACETYDSTAWLAAGGAVVLLGLVVAALGPAALAALRRALV
jgi:uncharacterized membrane protein